jgi:pimeloyl-ACP methyl ester carboxylesterase
MPRATRPDGIELHWEERGDGPLLVVANQFFGFPETFAVLIDDLARDHRVVTYHLRGTGRSTREGPYNLDVDAEDLGAVIEDAGAPALVVCMGDGTNRTVKLAARRPELVTQVISPGGNPVGRRAAEGTDSLASSTSVLQALIGLLDTDYRAALRTMISSANPQLDDAAVRERLERTVEHCPHEAAAPRLRDWIESDATDDARALGDRLWLLEHGKNPWFVIESARKTSAFLPQARVEEVEDGPLSRPDITAGYVRQATARARVEASSAGSAEPIRGTIRGREQAV